MALIRDKQTRKRVASILKKLQNGASYCPPVDFSMRGLDSIAQLIPESRRSSARKIKSTLSPEMSDAYIGVLALGLLAIAMAEKDASLLPIAPGWGGHKNPNLVVCNLLVQATNLALSTIHLVEDGLDNGAKVILRALYETCWLILVISEDADKLIVYIESAENEKAEAIWHKHFTASKLMAALSEIENRMDFGEFVQVQYQQRKRDYATLSGRIHSSYLPMMVSAYAHSFEDDDKIRLSLFGEASASSRGTLLDLYWIIGYTLGLFWQILGRVHGFRTPTQSENWVAAAALRYCFAESVFGPRFVVKPWKHFPWNGESSQ